MKAKILDIAGKEKSSIDLPKCFSVKVREDIVAKVLETKKTKQPYGASPIAGNQSTASGSLKHQRGVWKSQYKRGMSRIPRKQMSRKGTQFNWVGAVVPQARGGRRAHPPKAWSMINILKLNKKEMRVALMSALAATVNSVLIAKRYARLEEKDVKKVPLVVESKFTTLKTKELNNSLQNILGKDIFEVVKKKRSIRAGVGKLRGRKHKTNAGLLVVVGKDEKIKTSLFEVQNTTELGVADLAKGGVGRLTMYTEKAIGEIGEKLKC